MQLPVPQDVDLTSLNGQATNLHPESLAPDHIDTDEGPQLTPLGRYQVC